MNIPLIYYKCIFLKYFKGNSYSIRILFAASEYATKWPGMIDGAIEIGEVTACLILLKLRPQSLETADMVTMYVLNLPIHYTITT